MWKIYILLSLKDNKTYTGSTNSIDRRICEHSAGFVTATKNRLPIKLIYAEDAIDEISARKKEKYYKSCAGRKKLKIILKDII